MEAADRSDELSRIEALESRVTSLEVELEQLRKAFLDFKQAFE
jgi:hypothetical protein